MSRQAIVGAFALVGIVALFAVYFVLSNLAARVSGYEIGVHFDNASGLTRGSIVYESGVQVGTVSEIKMLPDYTIDVVMSILSTARVPRKSEFVVSAPLTGSSVVTIVPPRQPEAQADLLRTVLPVAEQPKGTTPQSIQDLLHASRGSLAKLDRIMDQLAQREPKLLDTLQSAIDNANHLAITANTAMNDFSRRGEELTSSLQRSLEVASANIVDLTARLDDTTKRNGGRIDALLVSLNRTATSLSNATASMEQLATNPQVHDDLIKTAQKIAVTTSNMAALSDDLRHAAEDPQTQGQLRDTLAHIDAASQRASSLLGTLGGSSSVYGVDSGATPPAATSPGPGGGRIVPAPPAPGVPTPIPQEQKEKKGSVRLNPAVRDRIGALAKNLVEVQIRLSELSIKSTTTKNTALLNSDRGPQSDFNVVLNPHAESQLFTGVNDVSGNQTWNFAMRERVSPNILLGGGILYSRLGVMGIVSKGVFGFEGLAYDPRYGYVDAYLRLHATHNLDLFAGERDIMHDTRRTTYGLQYRLLGGQ
jgi:phospholipid/cholesterol/gamma-HCH transport system substrate-binding protein